MTVLLWMLVAMGVWYIAGREQDAEMKALSIRTDTARVAFDTAVTVVMQTRGKSREAGRKEREAQVALTARLESMADSITYFRRVLADGTTTADTLRVALAKATDQLDTLRGAAMAYTETVDSLKTAYAEERRAATVALEKAESLIALQDSLIKLKQPKRLSRTTLQAFGVGVGVGILLVLAR